MSKSPVIILGIDPGLATTGFGVISYADKTLTYKECGAIVTKKTIRLPQRLYMINTAIRALVRKYNPDVVVVEQLFFAKNAKTAFAVGQARGVALLALVKSRARIAEYSPLQVKQTVTGYGKADKRQVQQMVRRILKLRELPRPDDASDALAAAICWVYMEGRKKHYD